jgi:hypothetical protein
MADFKIYLTGGHVLQVSSEEEPTFEGPLHWVHVGPYNVNGAFVCAVERVEVKPIPAVSGMMTGSSNRS